MLTETPQSVLRQIDDLDELCAAMLSLSSDAARREDLSARVRQRAAQFSGERFIEQNLDANQVALSI